MTTSPTKTATSVLNQVFEGFYEWSPLSASRIATTGDELYISSTAGTTYNTNVLRVQNFGHSIPSNATISRIGVYISKRASEALVAVDSVVQLVNSGSGVSARIGPNKAKTQDRWGQTFSEWSYYWTGTDLADITPSIINSADFGLDIRVGSSSGYPSVYIDSVKMWVEYSVPIILEDASINPDIIVVGTPYLGTVARLTIPLVGSRHLAMNEMEVVPVNFDLTANSTDRRGIITGQYSSGGTSPGVLSLLWVDFVTGSPVKQADIGKIYEFDLVRSASEANNSPKSQRFSLTVVEGSPVDIIGVSSGTTSAGAITNTLPGDLQIAFAYRDGSNTLPTLPAGWTSIAAPTGISTNSMRLAYRLAGTTNSASGTWTGATSVAMITLRPRDGHTISIGNMAIGSGATNSFSYPNITVSNTKSLILLFAGHRSTNQPLENPPSPEVFKNLLTVVDTTDEIAVHYAPYLNTAGVITPGSIAMTGTASGWFTASLEIKAEPILTKKLIRQSYCV